MLNKVSMLFLILTLSITSFAENQSIHKLEQQLNETYSISHRVSIYNRLAFEYMYFDSIKSTEYANLALEFNTNKMIEERISSLLIIGFNESIKDYLKKNEKIVEANLLIEKNNIKSRKLLAFSYFITGSSSIYSDNKSEAFDLILKANDLYFKDKNLLMYNLTKSTLATLHIELGQLNKAKNIMLETLLYFEENNLEKYTILAKRKLAYIYELNNDFKRAEELYIESIKLSQFRYKILQPYVTNTLISFYLNRSNPHKALDIYNRYISDNIDNIQIMERVFIYKNLTSIYTMLGEYDLALSYANLITDKVKDSINLLNSINNQIGNIYLKKNELAKAEEYLINVWDSIKNEDYSYIMKENLTSLVDLYNRKNSIENKYKFTNIHLRKLILYNNSSSYQNLLKSEENFQITQREQEITEVKIDQRFRLQSLFIISFLLILVIIAIIIQLRTVRKDKRIFENMARTDFLTNLYNRRTFLEKVEEENIRYYRSGNWYSIIITDIDGFKLFNDNYGHECGDEVLKVVSTTLRRTCRKQDTVARWGGEEFIILLPSTSTPGAKVIAQRLRENIEKIEYAFNNQMLKITMTFGIAQFEEELNIDQIIHNSDLALLHGKQSGKNTVICYSDIKDLEPPL